MLNEPAGGRLVSTCAPTAGGGDHNLRPELSLRSGVFSLAHPSDRRGTTALERFRTRPLTTANRRVASRRSWRSALRRRQRRW